MQAVKFGTPASLHTRSSCSPDPLHTDIPGIKRIVSVFLASDILSKQSLSRCSLEFLVLSSIHHHFPRIPLSSHFIRGPCCFCPSSPHRPAPSCHIHAPRPSSCVPNASIYSTTPPVTQSNGRLSGLGQSPRPPPLPLWHPPCRIPCAFCNKISLTEGPIPKF